MKFSGDHWKDKRYLVLCDVLKEAGFDPIRADQIKTSSPVVEEVCNYLRESPLVVIDSTGDSHSVSYEIGYCHGIGRSADKTILLRQGGEIPFNYRHFRNHCYRDLKHLRRLLRDWLSVIVPLKDESSGHAFSFEVLPGAAEYGATTAECFLQSLQNVKFSGRVEFFASEARFGKEQFYMIGLGLKFAGRSRGEKLVPDYRWWTKFAADVIKRIHGASCFLKLGVSLSDISTLKALRQTMHLHGIAQFENGLPTRIIGSDSNPSESWFLMSIQDLIADKATV